MLEACNWLKTLTVLKIRSIVGGKWLRLLEFSSGEHWRLLSPRLDCRNTTSPDVLTHIPIHSTPDCWGNRTEL
jgi:hypothetical protein